MKKVADTAKRLLERYKALLERYRKYDNNIFWCIFVTLLVYIFVGGFLEAYAFLWPLYTLFEWSDAMYFILDWYTYTIISVVVLHAYCRIFKKNRFILRSFLPAGKKGRTYATRVPEDAYEPARNNTVKMLLLGIAIGFGTNFFCIACAMLHGDIKLYFDFGPAQIPVLLFALLSVIIQGSSEEMWMRSFLYERLSIRYPLWVAIVVNGSLFGLLHMFNDGATVFAVIFLVIDGLSYALVRWYSGSMWLVFGMHFMWNFTQNFLFGLPNSGLVSEFSILHLDAANGVSNLIYNFDFGVESGLPSLIVSILMGVIVLLLAKKNGRLGELRMSYEKRAALAAAAEEE